MPPESPSSGIGVFCAGDTVAGCPFADGGTVRVWPATMPVELVAEGRALPEFPTLPTLGGGPLAGPALAGVVAAFVVTTTGFVGNLLTGAEALPASEGTAVPALDFGPGVATGALASVDGTR